MKDKVCSLVVNSFERKVVENTFRSLMATKSLLCSTLLREKVVIDLNPSGFDGISMVSSFDMTSNVFYPHHEIIFTKLVVEGSLIL